MQARPLILAERHHESALSMTLYNYLTTKNCKIDYVLFEGALTSDEHIAQSQKAFKIYGQAIGNYLKTKNPKEIKEFLLHDLQKQESQIPEPKGCDAFPHGFGQVRNLSVHFLIYQLLKSQSSEWIAIDSKRRIVKEFARKKLADGTAYLYKMHKFVGNVTKESQKALLEAAIIRSKLMADHIYDYALQGRVVGLVGERHCYDLAYYTPDLADIFGYHPFDDHEHNLYHYNLQKAELCFTPLAMPIDFEVYSRPVTAYNSKKLKSSFGLKSDYIGYLEALK